MAVQSSAGVKPEAREPERFRFKLSDLWIRTKERTIVPFEVNPVQQAYLNALLPDWRETGAEIGLTHHRDILLKARQFGMSTLILALMFLDTVNTPNTQTVVIAHDAESTETLFRMVHRFYDHLPADRRPKKKYSSKRELAFVENDSYFSVGTAGAGDYGRGGTINNVHGSEVSSWPDAEELVAGLLQAVPESGNVFMETTAKGVANYFHDEYQAAKRGDSSFKPRFYGWNLHPEYRRPVEVDFQRTEQEQTLAQRYKLDDEQLQWRRFKKKELKKQFEQEYPLNDQEAFVTSTGRVLEEFIPDLAPAGHKVPFFIPPKSWRHYLVVDPGWKKLAGLFAAIDPEGYVWLYGEHYEGGQSPKHHLAALDAWRTFYGKPDYTSLMDPAGFDPTRTHTGHPHPSWAAEFAEAAEELGIDWFHPSPAINSDPHALRVKRYLNNDLLRVCETLKFWLWEQERWTWQEPGTGRAQQNRRDPDKPIERFNHLMACFPAGTLISTETGERPIETLKAGELVWTRDGLSPVQAAWETGLREVAEVTFSDGRRVTATPDHPFWAVGRGWVRMDCLRYTDLCLQKSSISTESPTSGGLNPRIERIGSTIAAAWEAFASGSMWRFGRRLTGLFRKIARSTTRTGTPTTTPLIISNASRCPSIEPLTLREALTRLRPGRPISERWSRRPSPGTKRLPGLSGISSTASIARRSERPSISFASTAAKSLRPTRPALTDSVRTTAEPMPERHPASMISSESARDAASRSRSTAILAPELAPVRVVAVRAGLKPERVFNLQAAGTPEYFANGILVHNCTRYLFNTLPDPEPVDAPVRTVYERHWDDIRASHEQEAREARWDDE